MADNFDDPNLDPTLVTKNAQDSTEAIRVLINWMCEISDALISYKFCGVDCYEEEGFDLNEYFEFKERIKLIKKRYEGILKIL